MRKHVKVTIDAEGRDKGKTFIIHELAAMPLEDWAIRAFIGLKNSGVAIDDDIAANGIAGMIEIGLSSFLSMDITYLRPLLTEMLSAIEFVPNAEKMDIKYPLVQFPDQLEEISTLFRLRAAWLSVNLGFFGSGASSPTPLKTGQRGQPDSSNT